MGKFLLFTALGVILLIVFLLSLKIFKLFRRDTQQVNVPLVSFYGTLIGALLVFFIGLLNSQWGTKVLAVPTSSEFKSLKDLSSGKKKSFNFKNPYEHYGTVDEDVDTCSSQPVDETEWGTVMTDTYSTGKPTPIYDELGDDIKIHTIHANNHYKNYQFIVKGNDGTDCKIVIKDYAERGKFTVNKNTYAIRVYPPKENDTEGEFSMSLLHLGIVKN